MPIAAISRRAALIILSILLLVSTAAAQTVGIGGDSTINQCERKSYSISVLNNSGSAVDHLVITARLGSLTGFAYVSGTSSLSVDGNPAFCTVDPAPSGTDLVWELDVDCPASPFTLNNGETLTVTFDLETGCDAVSGTLNARIDYEIGGTPFFNDSGVHTITVLPGGVTIRKTPNVIPARVGQDVTWTLEVRNSGQGTIANVVVTDLLGAGMAYVSSSPAGANSGQTTTWTSAQVPALALMNPGDIVNLDITATVTACENLNNTADARWGCDALNTCFDTASDGGTAEAAVQREVTSPLLDFVYPDVNFDEYCRDYADVSFPITNIGDGRAHNIRICADCSGFTPSNFSPGATHDGSCFTIPDLDPGESYTLSFRLTWTGDWCADAFPAGIRVCSKVYEDDCGNEFYPPIEVFNISGPADSPSVSVTKTGGPAVIQIGDSVTYQITSSYSGAISCGSGPGTTGDVTVTDTLPDGFTVTDAGGGTWTPGAGGTGGTITWTYTPPAGLSTAITIQAPDASQCETYCYTTFTNSVAATVTDCCGCTRTATDSQTTAIECEELADSEKSHSVITPGRCGLVEITNTYAFADNAALDGVDLSQMTFTENADNEMEYVPGTLTATLSGVGDITACATTGLTDTTPGAGGDLEIDFSACGGSVRNRTLTITYRMTITEDTVSACNGGSFYSWSDLDTGLTTGTNCLQDGVIHETTVISVAAPAMSLSMSGIGPIIDKCETNTVTMTLTRTSADVQPADVRLVLRGANYYAVNPGTAVCSGTVSPVSCTPAQVGDDYVWTFNDAFGADGDNAVIQLEMRKRCNDGGDLQAVAYFDDPCNDDATPDDTCSASASLSPVVVREGLLLIEKTPEVYRADDNTVEWSVYVTNRGTGSAYFVWLDDVLGAGLDYVNATVNNMTGVTITADQDHDGNTINGCTVLITEMAPGERRRVTLSALQVDCENLTNTATTAFGCNGEDCLPPITDTSVVELPAPLLTATTTVNTPVDACGNTSGSIVLRNSGQTHVYNLRVTETLPAGMLYVAGTTRWNLNGGTWNGPNAAYDPNPAVSPLQWTSTEITDLADLAPGDTLTIEFGLTADCPFTGGSVTADVNYENPCGDDYTTDQSVFSVSRRDPVITVEKTRVNQPVGCGELVEWTITVTNTSGYTLPIVWVEDVLDAAFTFDSSVGDPPFTSDDGTYNGVNTISWELRNLNHNDSVTLTLRATTDSSPCSPDLDNTVSAWWGCGAADGSSATKPGEDPPDNTLCLTSTGQTDVRTETRRPEVGFLDIALSPGTIDSCNQNTILTVTIENPGPTDAANLDLVITLPPGLTYNTGSAQSCIGTDGTCVPGAIADPAISGNTLTFTNTGSTASNLADLLQAAGGNDTLVLRFSVTSNCYVSDNIDFTLYFYDCCGDTQYNTSDSETLTSLYPDLTVSKTPASTQVDCGGNATWTVTVTNNGAGNAQVVRIEDTLGDWIDYIASTPAATSLGGQVYGWEITDLAPGASQSFTITGQLNPDAPRQDCAAALRQNNVRAIWGCGTSGDATDGDPTTTAYDCTHDTWAEADAALLLMPDLVVNNITPAITCNSDGSFSGTLSVRVRNRGDGIAAGGFTVEISDGKGWTQTVTHTGDLNPSTNVTLTVDTSTWNPGCHACAAPYVFTATVDPGDGICECREDNNTRVENYTAPIPDLTIADIDFSTLTCTSDNISGSVRVTVNNTGCVAAANVAVRLITDGCLAFSDVTLANVPAEGSATATFNVSGNWVDCTDADCNFVATVDPEGGICECDGTNNTRVETHSSALPDLVVTDIDFSNISCSADNVSGSVAVTVLNQGFGSAVNFQVSLATDGCLGFANQTVLVPLANGASTTVTFPVSASWADCTDCDCLFTATVDPTNAICECDGGNNQLQDTYTQSLPDLRVNAVTPSAACIADGNLSGTVTVNVSNTGCGDANNVVVRLISTCGVVFADQTVNLTAGASTDLTFSYTPDCSACTCIFISLIDPDSTICECSGSNNAMASAPFTLNIPDLEISNDTLAVTCLSDGQVQVSGTLTMANTGCGANLTADIPVRFTLYDDTGCAGTQISQWTETLSGVNIASGGGTQVFTIPPRSITADMVNNSSGCQVSIRVEADYSGTICECDGTDNTYCADNIPVDIPNLEVSGDTLEVNCFSDGQVRVSGTLTAANNGCGASLTSNIPVRFTLYDDTGCAGAIIDQWTETLSGVSIASGGGTQALTITPRDITTDMVANSTGCRVSIRVEADYTGSICESDGTDNTWCADNIPVDIPDLEAAADSLGVSCSSDGQYRISGTVTMANNGCGSNLNQDIPVRFTLYDRASCSGTPLSQWTETLSGVNITANGGTQVFTITDHTVTGNLCADAAACAVSIRVEADYTNSICESDGMDNTYCATPIPVDIPDLRVNTVTPSVTCTSDNNLSGSVTVNVSNTGCGDAANVVVRLTSDCGVTFMDQTVNLVAGASTDLTFNYVPDCGACTCTFTATIDPGNSICECDGADNTLAAAPYTHDIPDLEVSEDTLGVNCFSDGQVQVSGTLTMANNGCGTNLTADIPVRFTLYDDTGCTGTQIFQWTETLSGVSIASGGGTQVFTIPPRSITADMVDNSTGCRVSIRVEADYSGTICECDGTDNTYCASDIPVDIPDLEVSGDSLGVTCLTDGQVQVSGTLTMANNGCGTNLTADIPVRFTLYDNTGCTGTQISQWTETLSGVSIASGGGTQALTITPRDITADMVANSTGCLVSIRVEADYTGTICESDGTDNTYCANNISIDIPDLEVESDAISILCTSDGAARLAGTVTMVNNGCGSNLNRDIPVRFTLWREPNCGGDVLTQWTEILTAVNIPANGGTQTFAITPVDYSGNLCDITSDGNLFLSMEADYTGTICESDGTNNSACAAKPVAIPDLTITRISTDVVCADDGSLTGTTVTVYNPGNAPAVGVVVRLASDCGLTFSDQTVDLASGETRDLLFPFTAGISSCTCNFTATIDPDNVICECDGANNSLTSTSGMRIPDLEVFDTDLTATCSGDGRVTVSGDLVVVNNGCGPEFSGDIPVRFSLYDAPGCGGNLVDQWTGALTGSIPSAGGTRTFSLMDHETVTSLCPEGCTVSLLVELDHTRSICEWDGTDNTACTDLAIVIPDPAVTTVTPRIRCLSDGNLRGTVRVELANPGCAPVTGAVVRLTSNCGLRFTDQTVDLESGGTAELTFNFTPDCPMDRCTFIAVVDPDDAICECTEENNMLEASVSLPTIDLVPLEAAAECRPDGTVAVRVTLTNRGSRDSGNITIVLDAPDGSRADTMNIPVAAGETRTVELVSAAYPQGITGTFTVRLDSQDAACECDPDNNTIQVAVECAPTDKPMLVLEKRCPSAALPGSIIDFELIVSNPGNVDLTGVAIEDALPEFFAYVSGSAVLDGAPAADPDTGTPLVFVIGDLPAGASRTLRFRAVISAGTSPERFCNQALARGNPAESSSSVSGPGGTSVRIASDSVECCTHIGRESAGCCLQVTQVPVDGFQKPDVGISVIAPYFRTSPAMLAAWSAFGLWTDEPMPLDSTQYFMRQRLIHYALATMKALYVDSGQEREFDLDNQALSIGGARPRTRKHDSQWKWDGVDNRATVSQLGFEMLALHASLPHWKEAGHRQTAEKLLNRKLAFLEEHLEGLPHEWELRLRDDTENGKKRRRQSNEADHLDRSVLFFALHHLARAGKTAALRPARQVERQLAEFARQNPRDHELKAELFYIMGLAEAGQPGKAAERLERLDIDGASFADPGILGLAARAAHAAGDSRYVDWVEAMDRKFMAAPFGIIALDQGDFTHLVRLEDFAGLLLARTLPEPAADRGSQAAVLQRICDEAGLFLKQYQTTRGDPLLDFTLNPPVDRPALPLFAQTRGDNRTAPVFAESVLVHSPRAKPLAEILIPQRFSRKISSQWETSTGAISRLASVLFQMGNRYDSSPDPLVREEGRSLNRAARDYLSAMLSHAPGFIENGLLLAPGPGIARRAPLAALRDLDTLRGDGLAHLADLADLMVAERIFLDSTPPADHPLTTQARTSLDAHIALVRNLLDTGRLTERFIPYTAEESAGGDSRSTRPSHLTGAKLSFAGGFAIPETLTDDVDLRPEDILFLKLAPPEAGTALEASLRRFVDRENDPPSHTAARILGLEILERDPEAKRLRSRLEERWDRLFMLPQADRVDTIEGGTFHRYRPMDLAIHLAAAAEPAAGQSRRTLNMLTHFIEREWGVRYSGTKKMRLPSAEYWLVRESPRLRPEPGDILTIKVRVENRCREALTNALDLVQLFLKAVFQPGMVYLDTWGGGGVNVTGPFQWTLDSLAAGGVVEFFYQAFIPDNAAAGFIDGLLTARGFSEGSGDVCETSDPLQRLPILPLRSLQGLVYEDWNVNGRRDAGENGIAGIRLRDSRGLFLTSDGEGRFQVPSGGDQLGVQLDPDSLPANMVLSTPMTRMVSRFYRAPMEFGLVPCTTISGKVLSDRDGDGTPDAPTGGVAGAEIRAGDRRVFTDKDGRFRLANLPRTWVSRVKLVSPRGMVIRMDPEN